MCVDLHQPETDSRRNGTRGDPGQARTEGKTWKVEAVTVKRIRPPQPADSIKAIAAFAQLLRLGENPFPQSRMEGETLKVYLNRLLELIAEKLECAVDELRLDHNPALILRPYNPRIKNVAARYTPNANDSTALIYRSAHGHHIKTNVIGDGAQRSDTAERMHQRRMDENRGKRKRKPKAKIQQRRNPWGPKGSRPFNKRKLP